MPQRTRGQQLPDLYTIPEAALYLGCSRHHVYRLIAGGHLDTVDITVSTLRSKTRVTSDSLAAYVKRRTTARTKAM